MPRFFRDTRVHSFIAIPLKKPIQRVPERIHRPQIDVRLPSVQSPWEELLRASIQMFERGLKQKPPLARFT